MLAETPLPGLYAETAEQIGWPELVERYEADKFVFQVRDKTIEQAAADTPMQRAASPTWRSALSAMSFK